MSGLSPATQSLIEKYKLWHQALNAKEAVVTIHVDHVISKVAKIYERIREIVDWREKHLMRRIAIERILKRRLFIKADTLNTAEPFVFELIRGGYFPNDEIPKSKIDDIQKLIDKYTFIINNAPNPPKGINRGQLYVFLVSLAACEVEETLDPLFHSKERFLMEYMEADMHEKIVLGREVLAADKINEHEKGIQIFIAVQQALLKLDFPIISYYLLKRYYPSWQKYTADDMVFTANNIYTIWFRIKKSFEHPLADKFYKICEQYDTPYILVDDVLSEDPGSGFENLADPEKMHELIEEAYDQRYKTLKSRMGRTAFYSTLSIFITNVFSLYILEFPFAKYVMGHINLYAAVFDVLGPTLLMLFLVLTIRPPGKKNFDLVFKEVQKILYHLEDNDIQEVEFYPKRSFIFRVIIRAIYLISFCITLGVIIYILYLFNYPPLSYLLLIMFTSLIAFTGVKVRQRSRELDVTERKGSILNIIIDPLALPIVRLGKWISARWEKINIIGVFFIIMVDTPFLVFVEFLEQWRYFIKEKKEDIR